jgi:hypothetical protein
MLLSFRRCLPLFFVTSTGHQDRLVRSMEIALANDDALHSAWASDHLV